MPVPVVGQLVALNAFVDAEPAHGSYPTADAWNAAFNQRVADVWDVMRREVYPLSQFPDPLEKDRPPRNARVRRKVSPAYPMNLTPLAAQRTR
jgi:hypothetical protein